MAMILLQELAAPGCQICKVFEEFWRSVEKDFPGVQYQKIDVTTPEGQEIAQKYMIFASPAIIINGELFSSGGFDKQKFLEKLKEVAKQ